MTATGETSSDQQLGRSASRPACELLFDRVSSQSVSYPSWIYYPTSSAAPSWAHDLVHLVSASQDHIESTTHSGLTSDNVLLALRPGLELLGYTVEISKRRVDKVRRPVLFGEGGAERVAYE